MLICNLKSSCFIGDKCAHGRPHYNEGENCNIGGCCFDFHAKCIEIEAVLWNQEQTKGVYNENKTSKSG